MLTAPGTTPPRRRGICPLRANAYRALNQERRAAGLSPFTIEQLNRMTLWQMIEETNGLINAGKCERGLFAGAES